MSGVGYGSKDDDGSWGFRATADGKVILGNTSDDVIQVTGSLDIDGTAKSNHYVTTVGTQDLGNDTSSNLSITAGVMILDADSITGAPDGGMGGFVHTLSLPNGTTNGQRVTLIVNTTFGPADNVIIMPNPTNIGGAFGALVANSKTSVEFVWYGTHWFPVQ